MVSRAIDITGQTFNRFTVLERASNVGRNAAWKCRCACGNEKIIIGRYLITGRIKSCGCYARNRDVLQPITTDGTKICRVCKEAKPLDEVNWFRRETSLDGFRNECRECVRLKQERYNQSEERKIERKAYDQEKRASDPEWVAAQVMYLREWRKQNPDWRKEHEAKPDVKIRARSHNSRWRGRHREAEGEFTLIDIERIFTDQSGICFYCDDDLSDGSGTIDHFIPLSKGGSNWPRNLRIACLSCNSSKRNKLPSEFIPKIKRY